MQSADSPASRLLPFIIVAHNGQVETPALK